MSEQNTIKQVSVGDKIYDIDAILWDGLPIYAKQDALISGTNIKTINEQDILGSGNINIDNRFIEVSYSELVDLRDNSELITGREYRIIDYETKTTQENTRSVENYFDIIVTADSENTLSEIARACLPYFETNFYYENFNAKLEAWRIWYCLDNDKERFAWADENGTGVIYRMIDEWNNDCPYDFKNIQFKRIENDVEEWYYTFTWIGADNTVQDASVVGSYLVLDGYKYYSVHDNIIRMLSSAELSIPNATQFCVSLNNIVFVSNEQSDSFYGIFNNTFGVNNYNFTFGNNCSCNTFGNDCYNNTFGNNCYYNIFGNICHDNTFGDVCNYNTFGNDCYNNKFISYVQYNSFGNACYNNEFISYVQYNSFGNACYNNKITGQIKHSSFFGDIYNIYITKAGSNFFVLNGVNNSDISSHINLGKDYPVFIGFNSDKKIISKNILDAADVRQNFPVINRIDGTATVKPNTYNIWDTNTYPTNITLEEPAPAEMDIVNEYIIRFTIPSSLSSYSLSFNSAVKWVDNNTPIWQAGCTYEISIVDGYAVFFKYNN